MRFVGGFVPQLYCRRWVINAELNEHVEAKEKQRVYVVCQYSMTRDLEHDVAVHLSAKVDASIIQLWTCQAAVRQPCVWNKPTSRACAE